MAGMPGAQRFCTYDRKNSCPDSIAVHGLSVSGVHCHVLDASACATGA